VRRREALWWSHGEFELSQLLRSVNFKKRMEKYQKMLGCIDEATRALQKKGILLEHAQFILDELSNKITRGAVKEKGLG
jgi:hypothetical protein